MTEDDFELFGGRALVHERGAIVRVGEGRRARVLEELRVARRPARVRAVVVVPAAQLVRPERGAPAPAPHDRRTPLHLQRVRARAEEVRAAADDGARALALVRRDGHGDVEAVDEADAVGGEVGVAVVEDELGQGGRGGAAEAAALEAAAAVAGGAGEAVAVVGAGGAGPDAAGPVGGGGREGAVGEGGEGEAAALQDGVPGVGLNGGPDGVGAVVHQG